MPRRTIFLTPIIVLILGFAGGRPTAHAAGAVTFAPSVSYPVSGCACHLAMGDFNADGKLDLVTANDGGNTINTLLGNGNGTFQPAVSLGFFPDPTLVAVADFNGDAKADVVVAMLSPNRVDTLLGNGNGTFQPPLVGQALSIGRVSGIAVADFNGDSRPDVVVSDQNNGGVSVLLGTGSGGFQAAVHYGAGAHLAGVAVGDFNGDNKPDIAVADLVPSGSVHVLLNNGAGAFGTASGYTTGADSTAVASSDLNGDGKQDLIVTNQGSNTVSVLLGNGDGSFQAAVNYAAGGSPWGTGVAVADLNGDGTRDLVTANTTGNSLSVLLGNGNGTFQAPIVYNLGASFLHVVAADLNGDNRPDLAISGYTANSVATLLNTTVVYNFSGFFSPVDNPPTVNRTNSGRAVPFKFSLGGNQGLDIFAAGYPSSQQINCSTNAPVDVVEETVTAGQSSLSYDATTDRYSYVWKTDAAWAGTCRRFTIRLKDGTEHEALFEFTR